MIGCTHSMNRSVTSWCERASCCTVGRCAGTALLEPPSRPLVPARTRPLPPASGRPAAAGLALSSVPADAAMAVRMCMGNICRDARHHMTQHHSNSSRMVSSYCGVHACCWACAWAGLRHGDEALAPPTPDLHGHGQLALSQVPKHCLQGSARTDVLHRHQQHRPARTSEGSGVSGALEVHHQRDSMEPRRNRGAISL
jgi:hypothetical protein